MHAHVAPILVAVAILGSTPSPSPSPSPCDPYGPPRKVSGFGRTWEVSPCSGGGGNVTNAGGSPGGLSVITQPAVEPPSLRRHRAMERYLQAITNAAENPREYLLTPPGNSLPDCTYCWPGAIKDAPFAWAGANSWISYDRQSDNYYVLVRKWDGTLQLDGENLTTGSRWQTIYSPDGSSRGVDKAGTTWEYNPEECFYKNSTGKVCIGCGDARVCN